ncbi:hypothetical protein FQN60_002184, partial [Etheostoma spectabile]
MAQVAAAAVGAGPDVNAAGNPTENAMAYLQDEGVDLRQYSKQVESELQRIEQVSIKDYIKESQNIALLHNQITACDSILESDLSSISSEIQTLQQQSVSMNVRLKNRQAVRSHLSQLEFLEQLHELNNKINFAKELSFRETLACADIQDIVDRLKLKAVSKIREFILQKIYSFFYQFLLANERTVAKEIRDEYVDTMSKIYYSYFKSYSSRLLKVQVGGFSQLLLVSKNRSDLRRLVLCSSCLGGALVNMQLLDTQNDNKNWQMIEERFEIKKKDTPQGLFSGFFSKPSLKSRNTIFTLGQRGGILSPTELEGPILVPHTAQRGDSRYPYETLFRSQHYALLDNGCREYLFLSDFFMVTGNSALDLFNSIMGKTLSMFLVPTMHLKPHKSMSTYVSDCYDSIAVFLCIHIILRFRAITAKRTIPALDKSVEVENFVLKMAAEFPSRRDQLIFLINNYD